MSLLLPWRRRVQPRQTRLLRAAVIGTGRISEQHLRALAQDPHALTVAVCDLSPALARFTAERFGVEAWFTDYREMLRLCQPEVVHVLTPAQSHARVVSDCLRAGAHVMVEKPAALSMDSLQALLRIASQCERVLMESQNYRFNSPMLRVLSQLAEQAVGEVREVDVRLALPLRSPGNRYADSHLPHPSHRLPGGVVHEFMPHLCSLALATIPEDQQPQAARAWWRNEGGSPPFRFDDLDAVVLTASVHVRLRMSCHTWPASLSITVRGTAGEARAELFRPHGYVLGQARGGGALQLAPVLEGLSAAVRTPASILSKLHLGGYDGLHEMLHRAYRALASGSSLPVTESDMLRTRQLMDLLLQHEPLA